MIVPAAEAEITKGSRYGLAPTAVGVLADKAHTSNGKGFVGSTRSAISDGPRRWPHPSLADLLPSDTKDSLGDCQKICRWAPSGPIPSLRARIASPCHFSW